MAKAAERESLRLATLAHEETGYGIPADKHVKNSFAAVDVHNYFKRLRTVGVVRETESVIEIAAPARRRRGDHPVDQPDLDRDLQDSDRDQVAQRASCSARIRRRRAASSRRRA